MTLLHIRAGPAAILTRHFPFPNSQTHQTHHVFLSYGNPRLHGHRSQEHGGALPSPPPAYFPSCVVRAQDRANSPGGSSDIQHRARQCQQGLMAQLAGIHSVRNGQGAQSTRYPVAASMLNRRAAGAHALYRAAAASMRGVCLTRGVDCLTCSLHVSVVDVQTRAILPTWDQNLPISQLAHARTRLNRRRVLMFRCPRPQPALRSSGTAQTAPSGWAPSLRATCRPT